jgi:predicted AlkP superfamily phosphohydrolase/phosphomutase
MKKLVIIGLDCATPQLVFDAWRRQLPNMSSLMERGVFAKLHSTTPPITVPAWTSMMTSWDPGMLGCYGFRNRRSYEYEDLYFSNAAYVKAKTVWNYLSRQRMRSLVMGVPQTFPPKPLNGKMVACFLTPDKTNVYTYPPELGAELDRIADGDYIIDVKDFRTDDKMKLFEDVRVMTERRFKAFRHLITKEEFDFAMMVEMGIDRLHHAFWRYFSKTHRLYEPGNPYENYMLEYYQQIDAEVGRTLEILDDETSVMIVSDHGAKDMHGAVCINEWLIREGYLTLKTEPAKRTKLTTDMIDWKKTVAWGEGGYYGRLFMNVAGREPQGRVPLGDYEKVRDEIRDKLRAITDEKGNNIGTEAHKPEEVYREVKNIPPDLIIYFGNLNWRSAGTVGNGTIHLFENDTGPDDANHAENGIFIWDRPKATLARVSDQYSIYDVAPTILRYFGIEVPGDMIGRSII